MFKVEFIGQSYLKLFEILSDFQTDFNLSILRDALSLLFKIYFNAKQIILLQVGTKMYLNSVFLCDTI